MAELTEQARNVLARWEGWTFAPFPGSGGDGMWLPPGETTPDPDKDVLPTYLTGDDAMRLLDKAESDGMGLDIDSHCGYVDSGYREFDFESWAKFPEAVAQAVAYELERISQ